MMTPDETVVMKNPDIVFREEDDGAFLFNPESDTLHCLNKVGAAVFKLCNGKNTLETMCRLLSEEYEIGVGPETLKKDVQAFIDRLVALHFMKQQE
ncbi:MAG: PqqD family protein [Pseudomonadota bacterium]